MNLDKTYQQQAVSRTKCLPLIIPEANHHQHHCHHQEFYQPRGILLPLVLHGECVWRGLNMTFPNCIFFICIYLCICMDLYVFLYNYLYMYCIYIFVYVHPGECGVG